MTVPPCAKLHLPGLLAAGAPAATPDTVFACSNTGYSLLGCLVEKLTGTPYPEAVTRDILGPLGMAGSRFLLSDPDARQCVMGFERRGASNRSASR